MIRNLRRLTVAAMAVAALSVFAAPTAQAHTPATFHCELLSCVVTLKPDGTVGGKTAHHVIDFTLGGETFAITCNQLTGEGIPNQKTSTELTLTNPTYDGCTYLGTTVTPRMNGCDFLITAAAAIVVKCPALKEIEFEVGPCAVHIPAQGPLNGLSYHDPSPPKNEQITMSMLVKGLSGTATGGLPCPTGNFNTGEYATGNTILVGETTMGVPENFWWTATVP